MKGNLAEWALVAAMLVIFVIFGLVVGDLMR